MALTAATLTATSSHRRRQPPPAAASRAASWTTSLLLLLRPVAEATSLRRIEAVNAVASLWHGSSEERRALQQLPEACARPCKYDYECLAKPSTGAAGAPPNPDFGPGSFPNSNCGTATCDAATGICSLQAWYGMKLPECKFRYCEKDDSKCADGPVTGVEYVEGKCAGHGNDECVYRWCSAPQEQTQQEQTQQQAQDQNTVGRGEENQTRKKRKKLTASQRMDKKLKRLRRKKRRQRRKQKKLRQQKLKEQEEQEAAARPRSSLNPDSCPADPPENGSVCSSLDGRCEYGIECCCGDCNRPPLIWCDCQNDGGGGTFTFRCGKRQPMPCPPMCPGATGSGGGGPMGGQGDAHVEEPHDQFDGP